MDLRQPNTPEGGQQVEDNERPESGAPEQQKASWKSLFSLKTLLSMDMAAEAARSEAEEESVSSRLDDCLRAGWAGALTPGDIRSPFDS